MSSQVQTLPYVRRRVPGGGDFNESPASETAVIGNAVVIESEMTQWLSKR
jgi:hypothetical protein